MRLLSCMLGCLWLCACAPDARLASPTGGEGGQGLSSGGSGGMGGDVGGQGGGEVPLTGAPVWSRSVGGAGRQEAAAVLPVLDRVFVGGRVDGEIALNGGTPQPVSDDGLVVVFDGNGSWVGEALFATNAPVGAEPTSVRALRSAPGGVVLVGGHFAGVLTWPAGDLDSGSAARSIFVAAVSEQDGSALMDLPPWALSATGDLDLGDMAVDEDGNVLLCGSFEGTMNVTHQVLDANGGRREFIAKLDPTGVPLWGYDVGEVMLGYSVCSLLVEADAVHLWTSFLGAFSLDDKGGGAPTVGMSASGAAVLATFSPEGFVIRASVFDGDNTEYAQGIAREDCPASTCDLVVVGDFLGTMEFPGFPLDEVGLADAFVARLAPDGAVRWARSYGDLRTEAPRAVAFDTRGNIVLTGFFGGTVNFGGETLDAASDDVNLFVAKLSGDGDHVWSAAYGLAGDDRTYALAQDGNDNIFIAGGFAGDLTIGDALTASGTDFFDQDMFVAKLEP